MIMSVSHHSTIVIVVQRWDRWSSSSSFSYSFLSFGHCCCSITQPNSTPLPRVSQSFPNEERRERKIFIIAMTIQSTVMPYRIKVLKKRREKRVGSVPSGPAPAVLFVFFSIKRETRQRKRDRQIQLLESRDLSSFSGRCWNNKKV